MVESYNVTYRPRPHGSESPLRSLSLSGDTLMWALPITSQWAWPERCLAGVGRGYRSRDRSRPIMASGRMPTFSTTYATDGRRLVCADIDERRLELRHVWRHWCVRRHDVVRRRRLLLFCGAFYLRKLYPQSSVLSLQMLIMKLCNVAVMCRFSSTEIEMQRRITGWLSLHTFRITLDLLTFKKSFSWASH